MCLKLQYALWHKRPTSLLVISVDPFLSPAGSHPHTRMGRMGITELGWQCAGGESYCAQRRTLGQPLKSHSVCQSLHRFAPEAGSWNITEIIEKKNMYGKDASKYQKTHSTGTCWRQCFPFGNTTETSDLHNHYIPRIMAQKWCLIPRKGNLSTRGWHTNQLNVELAR